jgi:hypothetical protein
MIATLYDEVTRARATERADLDEGWVLLREVAERCHLLDQCVAKHREMARKEAEQIHTRAADEAEEVLARARSIARESWPRHTTRPQRSHPQRARGFPPPLGLPTQPWLTKRLGG